MPYVVPALREPLSERRIAPSNPGELNFAITDLILQYYRGSPRNYQAINDVLGALEGAKLEFYRRTAAPYEDVKIEENGDI